MTTSGSLTRWVQDLTGGASFADLVHEAEQVPAGSNGLLLLPYFAGERTPVFDPRARGVIAGLTLRHTRGDLFRAVYEGIAFGIRQILELLDTDATPSTASSPSAAAPRVASGHRSSATSAAGSRRYPNRLSGLATATP